MQTDYVVTLTAKLHIKYISQANPAFAPVRSINLSTHCLQPITKGDSNPLEESCRAYTSKVPPRIDSQHLLLHVCTPELRAKEYVTEVVKQYESIRRNHFFSGKTSHRKWNAERLVRLQRKVCMLHLSGTEAGQHPACRVANSGIFDTIRTGGIDRRHCR